MSLDLPAPPSPTPRPSSQIWLAGILVGDIAIACLYGGCLYVMRKMDIPGMFGVPNLFLVPALGGLIASYIWRSLIPTIGSTVLNTLWMTVVALVAGTVLFHEGVICLLILSPLFFAAVLTGSLLGRILFKSEPKRLQLSFVPLLGLLALVEVFTRVDKERVVTDQIVIQAPAAKVWACLKSFPEIPSSPRFWLFRLGLPYPVATTASGDFLNAERECIFSQGAIFKEKVVELIPQQKFTFEIIESPPDPELVGHLTPRRGQFVLRANPDGTTTLAGSTWYTLHVRPLWYFDLWTHYIFRAVHLRVMEDIRRRAESSP